jgi:hypothetical protein
MFPGHFREHQLWETQNRAAILSLRRNGKPLADTYRQFPKFRNFVFFYLITLSGADCKWVFLGHAHLP